jgi:hypothetical protein
MPAPGSAQTAKEKAITAAMAIMPKTLNVFFIRTPFTLVVMLFHINYLT